MLTEAQLKMRMNGIGASEIGAVAGLCRYSGPVDIYHKKQGLTVTKENHHMKRGTYLERGMVPWYEDITGAQVEYPLDTMVHPESEIFLATLDGISSHVDWPDRRDLELKSPSWHTAKYWGEPGTDAIDPQYIPQVMQQMAVAGLKRADVGALINGDLAIYTIDFDQELWDMLREAGERFWRDYIVADVMPPADGSKACAEVLAAKFPTHQGDELLTADDQIIGEILSLRETKAAIELLEGKRKEAENKIKAAIGDASGLTGDFGRITWRKGKDGSRVDYKAIVEALNVPKELLEQHTHSKPGSRRFLTNWKKED